MKQPGALHDAPQSAGAVHRQRYCGEAATDTSKDNKNVWGPLIGKIPGPSGIDHFVDNRCPDPFSKFSDPPGGPRLDHA